jgi:hypothetical protein
MTLTVLSPPLTTNSVSCVIAAIGTLEGLAISWSLPSIFMPSEEQAPSTGAKPAMKTNREPTFLTCAPIGAY